MIRPKQQPFPFKKINYILLVVAIICIIVGYSLMLLDDTPYGFGTLSLVAAPILLVTGFIIPIIAITYRAEKK